MKVLETTLEPDDKQVLQVKYASKQFGKMDWDEVNKWTKALLIKINAITGWVINEATMDILVDQFRKHLSENYADTNADEVEYAFRRYGTVVKDWGKQMNLSLIDEILIPYKAERYEVSKVEERMIVQEEAKQVEYKEDMSEIAMRDWFKDQARQFELDPNRPVAYAPLGLYDWLDRTDRIKKTGKEKYDYLVQAVAIRQGSLIEAVTNDDSYENRAALSKFNDMKESGEYKGDEIDRLKNIAKRLILKEMLLDREFRF